MIKAIIFDLGGVIQGLDWSFVVNSILDLKEDLNIDTYRNAFYHERERYFDLYSVSKISKEEFWKMVASNLGIDEKNIDRLSESFKNLYSYVNYDIIDLIKELKINYKLFVLSNSCPELEERLLEGNIYTHLFDKLYFSHNILVKKPDKNSYLKITDENKLKPEECLFIDNDIENIIGAEKVGMKAILILNIKMLKDSLSQQLKRDFNKNKEVIGYTTGVYDLFHQGHLNFLINAKKYCDKLIVGVTSDELSINFKGKKPIIPLNERLEIIKSIKYVDEAVPQESMDKFEAWKKYRFDIMFTSKNPTKKWPDVEKEFLIKFKEKNMIPPKIIALNYTANISSTIRRNLFIK